ncbi:MAG: GNAT family N-acetyltransferase [Rhodobacteraceae bacterium]|nr:GNAT family N-acetyltransferase [Paracoccaceae bacterium]
MADWSEARFTAQEATWPAAEILDIGPWRARWTEGAGRRAASARPLTDDAAVLCAAIPQAEAFYTEKRADVLLQLPAAVAAEMAAVLAQRGYHAEAETRCLQAPAEALSMQPLSTEATPYLIHVSAPLAGLSELWETGGVQAPRREVMARVAVGQRVAARLESRLIGAAFVGLAPAGAMLHAVYVKPSHRRRGVARDLGIGAAAWARRQGAERLLIDVEADNTPARALYSALGAREVGGYVYYRKPANG